MARKTRFITNFKHAELMSITIVWIDTKPKHSKITQITLKKIQQLHKQPSA